MSTETRMTYYCFLLHLKKPRVKPKSFVNCLFLRTILSPGLALGPAAWGLCHNATQSAGESSSLFILSKAGGVPTPCLPAVSQVLPRQHVSSCSQAHTRAHRYMLWSPLSHSPQHCTEHSVHPQTLCFIQTQSAAARRRHTGPSSVLPPDFGGKWHARKQIKQILSFIVIDKEAKSQLGSYGILHISNTWKDVQKNIF